jgi:hypothetical protein
MTELRRRMMEDMSLRGLSEATQRAYVDAVANLARYFKRSPNLLLDEELRRFFLFLKRHRSKSTVRVHLFAIKFVYRYTLRRLSLGRQALSLLPAGGVGLAGPLAAADEGAPMIPSTRTPLLRPAVELLAPTYRLDAPGHVRAHRTHRPARAALKAFPRQPLPPSRPRGPPSQSCLPAGRSSPAPKPLLA